MIPRILFVAQLFAFAFQAAGASGSELPRVEFTDVTRSAGIRFVHNNGATGDKLLPETMGGGVAFLD